MVRGGIDREGEGREGEKKRKEEDEKRKTLTHTREKQKEMHQLTILCTIHHIGQSNHCSSNPNNNTSRKMT